MKFASSVGLAQQTATVTHAHTLASKSVCSTVGCWQANPPNHVGLIRAEEMAELNRVRGNEKNEGNQRAENQR